MHHVDADVLEAPVLLDGNREVFVRVREDEAGVDAAPVQRPPPRDAA